MSKETEVKKDHKARKIKNSRKERVDNSQI